MIKESAIVMLAWLTASKPRLEHLFGEHFHESPLSLLDFNTSVRAVIGNPCLKHSGNSARLAFAGELYIRLCTCDRMLYIAGQETQFLLSSCLLSSCGLLCYRCILAGLIQYETRSFNSELLFVGTGDLSLSGKVVYKAGGLKDKIAAALSANKKLVLAVPADHEREGKLVDDRGAVVS